MQQDEVTTFISFVFNGELRYTERRDMTVSEFLKSVLSSTTPGSNSADHVMLGKKDAYPIDPNANLVDLTDSNGIFWYGNEGQPFYIMTRAEAKHEQAMSRVVFCSDMLISVAGLLLFSLVMGMIGGGSDAYTGPGISPDSQPKGLVKYHKLPLAE